MVQQDFTVRYYHMTIEGLGGERFVVAKLRRVSSPPVQVGTVSDSLSSALGRLADIIRLGRASQNFTDLKAVEWALAPEFMESAEAEWAAYQQVICQVMGVERLEPLRPTTIAGAARQPPSLSVSFHEASMNDRPYLVARVGSIFGSPAPVFMTLGHERDSAMYRLMDVFRIGIRGQAFGDFMEARRRLGKREAEILDEWTSNGSVLLP